MSWTTQHDTSRGVENRQMTHDFDKGVQVITDFGFKTIRVCYDGEVAETVSLDDYTTIGAYLGFLLHVEETANKL